MEMEEYSSISGKKKVRNDGFYPLEGCDLTRRIFLLPTKIEKMMGRNRLTILIPTTKKTKTVPTRIQLLIVRILEQWPRQPMTNNFRR